MFSKRSVGILAFGAVLALAALSPESGEIRGTVAFADTGEPLPGVELTATSDGRRWRIFTGYDGQFRLSGLPQGSYELSAKLQGFRTVKRLDVRVPVAGTVIVDITMELSGPLSTYAWVIPKGGLREAYRSADAVVHLQITRSMEAGPWPEDRWDMNSVVGTEHVAIVLDAIKADPVHGLQFGSELRFVQYPAGTFWDHGVKRSEGIETPYSPGEEYVAFLEWDSRFERFARYVGPVFTLPVLDDRVSLDRADVDVSAVPGLRDGMGVESFIAALRELSAWQRESR